MTAADAWRVLARAAELRAEGRDASDLPGVDDALTALDEAGEPEAAVCLATMATPAAELAEERASRPEVIAGVRRALGRE